MKLSLFLLLSILSTSVFAQTLCHESYATLPIQIGGRVKPLLVAADETLRFITGKAKPFEESSILSFCKLSFEGMGLPSNLDLPVKVEHVDAKKLLEMSDKDSSMVLSKLTLRTDDLRAEYQKRKENDAYKKELSKILSRLQVSEELTRGQTWTIPAQVEGKTVWQTLPEYVREEKVTALRGTVSDPILTLFDQARATYAQAQGDQYMLEYHYYRLNPFLWAMVLGLISLAVVFTVKSNKVALSFSVVCILIQLAGMVLRVFISGRAPITNMYETVMFSGLGAQIIALVLTMWKKERNFLLAGLGYNVLCLMMMKFANNMLDPAISPLVPVLRDNFWLSTHVTTIILSYAALALSWLLANIVLIRQSFKGATNLEVREQTNQVYSCIKFGVVLLAAGIILGGVWADYSWGRFWGWDPKETWSLITWFLYAATLHARFTRGWGGKRIAWLAILGFLAVLFTYYGVNFLLSGLHSYGG